MSDDGLNENIHRAHELRRLSIFSQASPTPPVPMPVDDKISDYFSLAEPKTQEDEFFMKHWAGVKQGSKSDTWMGCWPEQATA